METTATTAETYRKHAENGTLDRMAGQAIQTKAQYKEANQGLSYTDFEDCYRAYRAGFRGTK